MMPDNFIRHKMARINLSNSQAAQVSPDSARLSKFDSPLRLGKEVRRGRNQDRFAGGTPEGVRP
jgi:hypothetical protein